MKRIALFRRLMIAVLLTLLLALAGCSSGSDGAPGATGATGATGAAGPVTLNPPIYTQYQKVQVSTQDKIANAVTGPHGEAFLAVGASVPVTTTITGSAVNGAGVASVTYTVTNTATGAAVTGLTAASQASFAIARLKPRDAIGAAGALNYNQWVPYVNQASGTVPATNYPYRERNSAVAGVNPITEGPAGTYTYTFTTNLIAATFPVTGVLVGYDATQTHRVLVSLRSGYAGDGTFDFIPAGGAVTEKRDIIVDDATCNKCHKSIPGHYNSVKACVVCHNPSNQMPNDAGTVNSLEASVFLHKVHAGRELASSPGADGIFFDDPATAADESADNGTYALGGLTDTWRSGAFPAVLANCVVCHTGAGTNVDNWKNVASRAACGSCHDLINWTTGANHAGGSVANDDACVVCHPSSGVGFGQSVVTGHNWTTKDIRNIQEFTTTVTFDTPARGYYIAGETPVVTVVLKDAVTGATIDHTTVVEKATADGCVVTATDTTVCSNTATAGFRAANMYVTGPRAKRVPVLTTNARAYVKSATTGPWNLSAGGASLRVVVDNGNFIVFPDHLGEDVLVPGDFTVTLPAAGASLNALFANPAAATAAEVAAALNSTGAKFTYNEREFLFSDRAIAYVGGRLANDAGLLSIRTRGLGSDNPTIQVPDNTTADLAGIFTDHAVKVVGSAVQLRTRTSAANADPKLAITAANIKYTLDPVDDLTAGTYMINTEIGIRGNNTSAVPGSYRSYSIAVATFQVKTGTVEKQIADGCTKCHWSTDTVGAGVGFVLDPIRHNKPFNATAIDQCGGCHEYASGETVATRTWTTGGGSGKPISKRVHAAHRGAELAYPTLTVDHEDTTIGRGWQINYPMNILNCQSCHSAATSGSWKNVPNRLACMGCHDSDQATAHMNLQYTDPTPTAPWSGDEKESCAVCH